MTDVLVTRPMETSRQLAGKLVEYGLNPLVMPLYGFTAIRTQPGLDFFSAWSARPGRKLAVFTSPRAVRFGLPNIPSGHLNKLEFVVVGSATGNELEALGHAVHLQPSAGFTSEDLLQMPELRRDPGLAVIFCAPDGRETLAQGLAALGWEVVKAMVYERVPLTPGVAQIKAILGSRDLISIWTSTSALNIAGEVLPRTAWDKLLKAPALVISARIQHHLHEQGFACVELADGPGNKDLLRSILRFTGRAATV